MDNIYNEYCERMTRTFKQWFTELWNLLLKHHTEAELTNILRSERAIQTIERAYRMQKWPPHVAGEILDYPSLYK